LEECVSGYRIPIIQDLSKKDASKNIEKIDASSKKRMNGNIASLSNKPKLRIAMSAYKCRNVYKSIIRHICSYINQKGISMARILKSEGFSEEEIKEAYKCIDQLKKLDKSKGVTKNQKSTISAMIETKSIYTYILKETLQSLIDKWELGEKGKIMEKNIKAYIAVWKVYYKRCSELLN